MIQGIADVTLTDRDISAILRIVDESGLDELHLETAGLELHVRRGEAPPTGDGQLVTAPMLGTFHRSASAGEAPVIEVGSRVEPDTVVCLIAVLKSTNRVEAGVSGTVTEVLAGDRDLVEFGQPLFRVGAPT